MKKSWIIIVALTLLASSGWANLLSNPGFEQGAANWTFNGGMTQNDWARRSGTNALVMGVWHSPTNGIVSQEVPVSSTGTYTFTIWTTRETNTPLTALQLRLDWLDSGGALLGDTPGTASYVNLPKDISWHQLFVTGNCTNSALAKVRVAVTSCWVSAGGDGSSVMYDDADFYAGPYAGNRLANGGLETFGSWRNNQWNGSMDMYGWDQGGMLGQDWAARWGTNGLALYSFANPAAGTSWTLTTWQNVVPTTGTGTYHFAVWIMREANALVSNAYFKIEWYDSTFSNKVSDDIVSNITLANDGAWHDRYVQGVCTNANLHEARVTMHYEWSYNSGGDPRATKIDDVRFAYGPYTTNVVYYDWGYHAGGANSPREEQVPGNLGLGSFLQVNYMTGTNRTFVLAERPSVAQRSFESGVVALRTSWQRPDGGAWVNGFLLMTNVATIVVSNTAPFHGQPSVGTKTMDVWRVDWARPRTTNDLYHLTNVVRVYYTPVLAAVDGNAASDFKWALLKNGDLTNNLGQIFGRDYNGNDYCYDDIHPNPQGALTNGDFEVPPSAIIQGSGWRWIERVSRDTWSARTGTYGGTFQTWDPGEAQVLQDILVTTGRTYTFSAWMLINAGATPTNTKLVMEWYSTNMVLLQKDEKSLTALAKNNTWYPLFITGSCTSNDLWFVRPIVLSQFNDGTIPFNEAMYLDDAAFYEGTYLVKVQDGGFERGDPAWSYAQFSGRDGWAGDFSPWGADFQAWDTNQLEYQTTISQPVGVPGTGTYSFSVWMSREQNVLLTNMELRLDWYNSTGTQLVQQVSSNIMATLPADNLFREYYMNGTCTSPAAMFVRPVLFGQWQRETNFTWGHANKIDNLRLMTGAYVYPLRLDWTYHSAGAQSPFVEQVPGTSNFGAFAQVSYASTTTTFFALADDITNITLRPDETAVVCLRTAWQRPPGDPHAGDWVEQRSNMTWVGTADLSAFSFHGSPLSGSQRVNIWRIYWQQPLNTNGVPYTNTMQVYYSPFLKTTYDSGEVEPGRIFFAQHDGTTNNNYASEPQLFHPIYAGVDYVYTNARPFSSDIDGDGIPNDWESAHGMDPGDPTGTNGWFGDPDGDTSVNGDEYTADTDPQNGSAYFDAVITGAVGFAVTEITAGPPTTNTRLYGAYWKTNLVAPGVPWLPYGPGVPGNDSTTVPLTITVTNDAALERFYRTGVRVP
ncbi:MAG: hypothetical protein V1873_01360 [Verrucomicrobiota bacterium]